MENISKKIVDELFEKVCQGDRVAFQELNRLSENGNARAMSALAKIYLKNLRGIKHSYKKAVELFEKAAALNEPYALYRLGEFYRDAKCGFKQDGNKAAEYFIRAAKTNIVNPSDNIRYWSLAAAIYHYGEGGVLPDGQKAIELYEKQDQIESQTDEGNDFITAKALFQIADIYIEGCGSVRPDGFKP